MTKLVSKKYVVSTHSRLKAAGELWYESQPIYTKFQHTAA